MKWENNRHIHIQLSYLESDQNRMAKRQYIRRWTGKWALGCLLAVSGLWTVSGLLAGCSEESVETSEELRLVLKLPPELTVDTRGEINNIPVNTIWVLQYVTENGVSKLKQKAFLVRLEIREAIRRLRSTPRMMMLFSLRRRVASMSLPMWTSRS